MQRTLVDVFESTLDRTLDRKEISRHPLRPRDAEELGEAVSRHYQSHEMPEKGVFDLRPSLSTDYTISRSAGLDYVFGERHYTQEARYEFAPNPGNRMAGTLKSLLLYAHSVVIQDPLPYLLDYFGGSPENDHAIARLPAVNSLLCDYADLAGLIRSEVVIPVSEPVIELGAVPSVSDDLIADMVSNLPAMPLPNVRLLIERVLVEQYRRRRFNDRVDLFFPEPDYVHVLRELLRTTERRFDSERITEPFGTAVIGSLKAIDTGLIDLADIARIRSNDGAFAEWRSFLQGVFREIHAQDHETLALDDEFVRGLRREFSARQAAFTSRMKDSSLNAALRTSGKGIAIGTTAGAIVGAATGDPSTSLAVTAAAGGIAPIVELLFHAVAGGGKRSAARSLRHHFLAVGFEEGELRAFDR